jgi:hypothetical protein
MAAQSGYSLKEAQEDREFWGRIIYPAPGADPPGARMLTKIRCHRDA